VQASLKELKLLKEEHLVLDRDELKKLLKEKGVKLLDDFDLPPVTISTLE